MVLWYKKMAERNCRITVIVPPFGYNILAYPLLRLRHTVSGDIYSVRPTSTQERFRTSHSTMQYCSCAGRSKLPTYAAACLGGIFCSFFRIAR